MTTISFIDTETLGLHADQHAVWEVALISYDTVERKVLRECLWQIHLTGLQIEHGDPVGMEIGKFADRYDEATATSPWDFCEEFAALTRGSHLCGNVVSFDEERIRRMCWEHGATPSWHYHLIDIEPMIVGYLRGMVKEAAMQNGHAANSHPVFRDALSLPWHSGALSEAVGVDKDQFAEHTAMGDARWAMAEWKAVNE